MTKVIFNEKHDTEGFVGWLPSDNSIYIAYRGSESLSNWITNIDATKSDYNDPNCSGCEVHTGFRNAQQSVWPDVL